MKIIEHRSPNHEPRPSGMPVDILVLHYTGMATGAAALARLCDPAARVSAHYLIEEDGRVFYLVPEDRRAWHAGASCWRGDRDVNGRSIGIELVNPGHEFGYRDFSAPQMDALLTLARDIVWRHRIPARNVVGHSDIAPARKSDPGERFDWGRLAAAGIGLWPAGSPQPAYVFDRGPAVTEAQRLLASYGYDAPQSGVLDEDTALVLQAFQRHFRQACVDGRLDAETLNRLKTLVDLAQQRR